MWIKIKNRLQLNICVPIVVQGRYAVLIAEDHNQENV